MKIDNPPLPPPQFFDPCSPHKNHHHPPHPKGHITFYFSGDLGDLIAGMAVVKSMTVRTGKKARVILDSTGGITGNDDDLNDLIAKQNDGFGLQMNFPACEFIKPLIEAQPYVESVFIEDSQKPREKIDINLNEFRKAWSDRAFQTAFRGNILFAFAKQFGLPYDIPAPWITVPDIKIPDNKRKTIIARSHKMQSAHLWFQKNQKKIALETNFIGTDSEYDALKKALRVAPPRLHIKDALEAAEYIASCDVVMANSTLFFWIALAMGKTIIHELPVDCWTTFFEDSENILYVQGIHRVPNRALIRAAEEEKARREASRQEVGFDNVIHGEFGDFRS